MAKRKVIFSVTLLVYFFNIVSLFGQNNDIQSFKEPWFGLKPPVEKAEVFMDEIISTYKSAEMCGMFSENGKEFFFNAEYKGNWTIMVTRLTKSGWIGPSPLIQNNGFTDRDFTMSPDGKRIYFGSDRPKVKGGNRQKQLDLFYIEEIGKQEWSDPVNIGFPVNTAGNENYPCVVSNGNLYFFTKKENGFGGCDLYVSKFINREYQKPENLGSKVNSKFHDWDAFIAPDESYIIFSSMDRPGTYGGQDLYISFKHENDGWTNAVNMGEKINSPYCEICPGVSLDGKILFFTTRRRGKADIFWMDATIIQELKVEVLKID